MMWWKFRRHRLAVVSGGDPARCSTLSILISEILAPYDLHTRNTDYIYAPPQAVHLFHEGRFVGPFVYGYDYQLDMETLKRDYTPDTDQAAAAALLLPRRRATSSGACSTGDFHLVCPAEGGTFFLLGTDRLGRDMLSRIIYGARISLTIGLLGIAVSFVLGIMLGGIAGYYGGWVDNVIQRIIEILRSLPELPLWMALSAALPVNWSPILVYFGITIILGLLDWPGLARAVRSKLLALREEDFATAARADGRDARRASSAATCCPAS